MSAPALGPEPASPFPLAAYAVRPDSDATPPSLQAPEPEIEPAPSRAGRNLPRATAVGLGLLALVGASLFIRKEVFAIIAFLAACVALWELDQALRTRHFRLPLLPLFVGSAGVITSALISGAEAMMVAFMLTVVGVVLWRVLDGVGVAGLRDAAAGTFAVAYIPFLIGFVMLLLAQTDGPERVLFFILLVVASDTGGYALGVLIGKHPMAPSISPKKSWEGFAGSVILSSIIGTVGVLLVWDEPFYIGIVLGACVTLAATLGDLSESMLKRDLGIKDMGTLLPDHGGLLDRIDSLLIAAPVCFALFTVLLPVLN